MEKALKIPKEIAEILKGDNLENFFDAIKEYSLRKERKAHPDGTFDKQKRWYPDDDKEKAGCCVGIRQPSAAYPYSLLTHCRSLEHLATLYKVDVKATKKLYNFMKKHDLFTDNFLEFKTNVSYFSLVEKMTAPAPEVANALSGVDKTSFTNKAAALQAKANQPKLTTNRPKL